MKAIATLITGALCVSGLAGNASAGHRHHASYTENNVVSVSHSHFLDWDEDTWFDIDDGAVVITHKERGEPRSTVEITEDHELYIDDERIPLDPEQQLLVGRFHDDCMELVDYAKEIGIEGAKIGVQGAKLGLHAVGCVFKLLSPSYDSDDLEAEMEHEASKIEAKAAVLEDRAELIEDMADDLDDQARDLRRAIPALDDLYWF